MATNSPMRRGESPVGQVRFRQVNALLMRDRNAQPPVPVPEVMPCPALTWLSPCADSQRIRAGIGATNIAGRAAKGDQRAGIGYTASQPSGTACSVQVGHSGR